MDYVHIYHWLSTFQAAVLATALCWLVGSGAGPVTQSPVEDQSITNSHRVVNVRHLGT